MEPRIEERDAFDVVGMQVRCVLPDVSAIPPLWERFIRRKDEVDARIEDATYGVCADDSASGRPGFLYTAAIGVAEQGRVPQGMVAFTVPGGTFAVFVHRGPISAFGATVQALWQRWLPASGLKPTGAPDFELYDARYKGEAPDSVVEIWVPVASRT